MTDPAPTAPEDLNHTLKQLYVKLAGDYSGSARDQLPEAMADWLHQHHPVLGQRPRYYALHLAQNYLIGTPAAPAEPAAYVRHRDNYYHLLRSTSSVRP